jgi:hypothetical protein
MTTLATTETELRHAVIDRLIAASLRDVSPAREAEMKSWRSLDVKPQAQVAGAPPADLKRV